MRAPMRLAKGARMIGTRIEQVRAHRFVTPRIVSATLAGEPESTSSPAAASR
jgi:hypothetical protein